MSQVSKQDAIQLLQAGDLDEAYKAFNEILHKDSEDWVVYDSLAYLENELKNNLEKAKHLIDKARELGCPEARYHRVCADILWSKGQLQKATFEFEKAASAERSVDNLTAFANSLMKTDFEDAIPVWEEIIEKEPNNVRAYLGLSWIAGEHNDWALALKTADKAKEFQPDNARILYYIGRAYQALGEYGKALEHYLEAGKEGFPEEFFFHGGVANCYVGLQDYSKALEHAYEAVKLKAQDSRTIELLTHCKEYLLWLCGEDRKSEAYPMMEIALKIWPDDSRLLAYMASLEMYFNRNYELGKKYIEKAFEYGNTDSDLLYQIKGSLWFDFLDKQEGLKYLEKAVSLDRRNFNLVALASRVIDTDPEKAKKLFEEVLCSDPDNAHAVYGLSNIALRNEDWQKGFELARRAYELDSSNPNINVSLAQANLGLGKLNEALRFYLKAEELGFSDKAYLYSSMAECYQGLDKSNKARTYARKALDIAPDNPEAKKLLDELEDN